MSDPLFPEEPPPVETPDTRSLYEIAIAEARQAVAVMEDTVRKMGHVVDKMATLAKWKTFLIFCLFVIIIVGAIVVQGQGDNIDKNSDNIAHLDASVQELTHVVNDLRATTDLTRADARRTREALEKALDRVGQGSDPEFIQQIKTGLEAIKRIEARLNEGG